MKKSASDYRNSCDTRPSRSRSCLFRQRQFFRNRITNKEWLRYMQQLKNSFLPARLS